MSFQTFIVAITADHVLMQTHASFIRLYATKQRDMQAAQHKYKHNTEDLIIMLNSPASPPSDSEIISKTNTESNPNVIYVHLGSWRVRINAGSHIKLQSKWVFTLILHCIVYAGPHTCYIIAEK